MISGFGNAMGFDPQMMAQMREQMFKRADNNGDGSLSKEEFTAAAPKQNGGPDAAEMFSRIDNNSDGKLDQSEMDAFGQKMMQAFQGGAGSVSGGGAGDTLQTLLDELQQAFQQNDGSGYAAKLKKLQQTVQEIVRPLQEAAPYGKDGAQDYAVRSSLLGLQT